MESSFFLQWSARYLLYRKMTFGFPASATHAQVEEAVTGSRRGCSQHTGKHVCACDQSKIRNNLAALRPFALAKST